MTDDILIGLGLALGPVGVWVTARCVPDRRRDVVPTDRAWGLLAGFFLALLLMGLVTWWSKRVGAYDGTTILAAHVGVAAFLIAWSGYGGRDDAALSPVRPSDVLRGIVAYATVFPALLALHSWVMRSGPGGDVGQEALGDLVRSFGTFDFWIRAVALTIAVPIFEECLVRGFLQRGLEGVLAAGGYGAYRWAAIVIASLVFTALHPPGTWISVMAVSLFLGFVAQRSGRLTTSIAAHGTHNLAVILYEAWRHRNV